jgi:hypothetical protein
MPRQFKSGFTAETYKGMNLEIALSNAIKTGAQQIDRFNFTTCQHSRSLPGVESV